MTSVQRRLLSVVAVVGLLGAHSGAARASDRDTFDKLLSKYAIEAAGLGVPGAKFKPKAACFCASPSAGPANAAGFVVRYEVGGLTYLNCFFPYFDAAGALDGYGYCNEFYAVGK